MKRNVVFKIVQVLIPFFLISILGCTSIKTEVPQYEYQPNGLAVLNIQEPLKLTPYDTTFTEPEGSVFL